MLIRTLKELAVAVEEAQNDKYIAVDIETTGLDLVTSEITGLGFATETGAWYVDFAELPDPLGIWTTVLPLFHLGTHILISHNTSFDMYFIHRDMVAMGLAPNFYEVCLHWWDTLSMAAFVDENIIGVKIPLVQEDTTVRAVGALSLKALSLIYLGRNQRLWSADFDSWPVEERATYGEADVRNTYDLAMVFADYLKSIGLLDYCQKYLVPMSFVTCRMQDLGIAVDIPKLLEVQEELKAEIETAYTATAAVMPPQETISVDLSKYAGSKAELQEQLLAIVSLVGAPDEYMLASGKVSTSKAKMSKLYKETQDNPFWNQVLTYEFSPANPNSYSQLGDYFLAKGYRLPMTPAGNYSVSADILMEVAKQHPEDAIWEYLFKMRKLEKLDGTYVSSLLEFAWEDDTVHPEWNQAGTVTGRYSAHTSTQNKVLQHKRGPAFQTIPRPDTIQEAGWEHNPRAWFIARPGYQLCVADLSQAEVRMLAVMSQDPALMAVMTSGEDLHSSIASRVWGARWDAASDAQKKVLRTNTKQATFGTIYGIGPTKLSEKLGILYEEAEALLGDFYDSFPQVSVWKQVEATQLLRHGHVVSLLGRRRQPILIQKPPRVTGAPGTREREVQKLRETLWKAEYDAACAKSRFDPETVEPRELEGRAIRQAVNFEIQGSVAEVVNYGLWRLVLAGYRVLAQVHDEVIVEVLNREEDRTELERLLREVYEIDIRGVPFVLDVHFGPSWAEEKEANNV